MAITVIRIWGKERTLRNKTLKKRKDRHWFFAFTVSLLMAAPVISGADNRTTSKTLTIGYLPIDKTPEGDRLVERQYRVISGALTLAIQTVNDMKVIPGYKLNFIWNDTFGTINGGLKAISDQWQRGVDVFLGPEETCNYEGRVAAAWNLPMLSYKCADDEVSDKKNYPTFARTTPPAVQVSTSIISLLLHYNWTRFTLVVGSSHPQQSVRQKLLSLCKEHNIVVGIVKEFKEPYLDQVAGNPFPGIVQDTYIETRVYVFLGQLNGFVAMMTNLNDRGLLQLGDYVVIFVDHRARLVDPDPTKYFKMTFDSADVVKFPNGERSLLVITPTSVAYDRNAVPFHERVVYYNSQPPFEFPNPFNVTKRITDYAAYLYDAVNLYAHAVADVLKEGGSVRNGTAVVSKIRGREYTSILGYATRIDINGDAEGNYTLLALKAYPSSVYNYSMRPIANFKMDVSASIPIFKMFEGESIPWINGIPPPAEPTCGYHNERCIPAKSFVKEIALGVVGGVALVFAVVALVIYRNWRYEQEIDGLLWKIDSSSVQTKHFPNGVVSNTDKLVHDGATISLVSTESRNSYTQVFAQTGIYKGRTVALKFYDKQKVDLGRHTKKEMKLLRDLRHANINSFIGASVDSDYVMLVTEYCSKGSLMDILENEDITLDNMFISSIVKDVLQGMIYLHDSELQYHGNLKSSNCLITSRWTVQIGDYGLLETRAMTYHPDDEYAYNRNLLWKAPELVRRSKPYKGSPKGDVYAFGIILYEIMGRTGPYGPCKLSPKEIIANVRNTKLAEETPFRPDTGVLSCDDYIIICMQECWAELPDQRPDFKSVWNKVKPMRAGMKRNIFDHMMGMMEKYQERLEELVEERTEQLVEEKKKTETLLHRMLPKSVAEELKRGQSVKPESFDSVTIYFSDICGFTKLSADSTPMQVVDMLNDLYTAFDSIVRHYDVYKVETIGDAYMVVSGLPIRNGDLHAGEVASMSLALLSAIKSFHIRHRPEETLKLRIGIHSGPCVAGVVGLTMPRYTLFGDTVNTASRMETNGEPLKVHCSAECKAILDKLGGYSTQERGYVTMKGKGTVLTYWLTGEVTDVRKARMQKFRLLQLRAADGSDSPAGSSCLQQMCGSSPQHSNLSSPHPSPVPGGASKGNRVKHADTMSVARPACSQAVTEMSRRRSVSSEFLNGVSSTFRGKILSLKDVWQRRNNSHLKDNSNSEPFITDKVHQQQTSATYTTFNTYEPALTPVLRGGSRRGNSHCVSVYDNAGSSELYVLLGNRSRQNVLAEEDGHEEEMESKHSVGIHDFSVL